MNLHGVLDAAADRHGDRGAVFAGDACVLTWAQLRLRTLAFGARLAALHGRGSRVAIVSENRAEIVELLFGTWAAGCAVVPVNAKLHPKETAQIVDDADAAVVFVSPRLADGLAAEVDATRLVTIGSPAYETLFDAAPLPPADVAPDALAWLFYTSGTTGRSKGAMLTHRNLLAMTVAHLADIEPDLDADCTQLHAAPMSHGSGLYIPASVARGARQVIPASGGFDAAEFLDLCDVHPGCGAFVAPTMLQRLRLAAEASGRRPRGLRSIVYGGGPMYVEELRRSLAVFGPVLAQIYGQGETPMTITGLTRRDHATGDPAVLGSVGWARAGVEVKVVDADGRALPADEPGEVVCRSDVVMAGYWRNPGATADALRGGWLRTGDVGSLDARGCLTLRDRSKDVVISGGSNVYPREVEEVLLAHPGVLECCVVGRRDAEWGEVVVAFVVAGPGCAVDAADLDARCLDRIARFKRPKEYRFVDALPKNAYGKVLKRELRERLRAEGGG